MGQGEEWKKAQTAVISDRRGMVGNKSCERTEMHFPDLRWTQQRGLDDEWSEQVSEEVGMKLWREWCGLRRISQKPIKVPSGSKGMV